MPVGTMSDKDNIALGTRMNTLEKSIKVLNESIAKIGQQKETAAVPVQVTPPGGDAAPVDYYIGNTNPKATEEIIAAVLESYCSSFLQGTD